MQHPLYRSSTSQIMKYKALTFSVSPLNPGRELLLASLEDTPVESVEDTEAGAIAYVTESAYRAEDYTDLAYLPADSFQVTLDVGEIETVNWNSEWEKHFDPVQIGDQLLIRAEFHSPQPHFKHEIVIRPKMAFGTGHHATTAQICQFMLNMDWAGKTVLDMGTGTGILAIAARIFGSGPVTAIDIDSWSTSNTAEHVELNQVNEIEIIEGDAAVIPDKKYEVIIANINRNVLLNDLQIYIEHLSEGGTLLLSGFMEADESQIREEVERWVQGSWERSLRGEWVALKFNQL